uniref:(northern house mosquito) hypothetical protein n=1 Tax=Culex pipiens TaxID=7175 RepID=A0A8D8G5Q6_CULPI
MMMMRMVSRFSTWWLMSVVGLSMPMVGMLWWMFRTIFFVSRCFRFLRLRLLSRFLGFSIPRVLLFFVIIRFFRLWLFSRFLCILFRLFLLCILFRFCLLGRFFIFRLCFLVAFFRFCSICNFSYLLLICNFERCIRIFGKYIFNDILDDEIVRSLCIGFVQRLAKDNTG